MFQMELVQTHFKTKFDKTGVALTVSQLLAFAAEKKLIGVTRQKVGQFLRTQHDLAQFAVARKTKEYQSSSVIRPGVYHLDFGEFKKPWATNNSGHTGFLVAVENFTNRLFVIPCRGKGTEEWLKAISTFVSTTRNVRTIFSDRDSVATSVAFRDKIIKDFGIRWYFLKKGHKAFLAERYIGFVKTKLSQALLHKGGKNWVQFVDPICSEYNKEKIAGTSYKRQSIERSNFSHFLSQLLKTEQPELRFNSFKAGPFAQEAWNRKIFKFNLGQKVLLARRANWKEHDEKLTAFTKISSVGGFGTTVYTVSGRQLRASKNNKAYVPVYSLLELGPSLHFYVNDLQAAST
jgi:hypothetical protein